MWKKEKAVYPSGDCHHRRLGDEPQGKEALPCRSHQSTAGVSESTVCWERLAAWARKRGFLQALLEEEVTPSSAAGNRSADRPWMPVRATGNGYGKPRRLSLTSGVSRSPNFP